MHQTQRAATTFLALLVAITAGLVLCKLTITASAQDVGRTRTRARSQNQQNDSSRVSGPYIHNNLTIFLVHGKDLITGHSFLTLQEALAQKKVIVYETKDVNELAIRNLSNQDVYVQSGDIVRGGDQDRMISTDFIVPPKSGRMPIAAFCVESGRWSRRGNEVNASFASSENSASTRELKLAAKSENSQQAVWENVAVAQEKLSKNVNATVTDAVSRSSLELSLENGKVKETAAAYIKTFANLLKNKNDVIGYVFAINGQVNSADVYASSALFAKLWPKLLRASAVEAIAELQEGAKPSPVAESAVTAFLTGPDKATSEKDVTRRVRLVKREDDDSVFFETRDRQKKDAWIHRNYIKK